MLPQSTAMNKDWYQNVLLEQLLPMIQEQFGDHLCILRAGPSLGQSVRFAFSQIMMFKVFFCLFH